jgi:hypothetical protein
MTAARILRGHMAGKLGPETPLAMDQFPYLALSKVSAKWPQGGLHQRGGCGPREQGRRESPKSVGG